MGLFVTTPKIKEKLEKQIEIFTKKQIILNNAFYESKFFDDRDKLKNFRKYKLQKLKIWYQLDKEMSIMGIQSTFIDKRGELLKCPIVSQRENDNSITEDTSKSHKKRILSKGIFYVDMSFHLNEYITAYTTQCDGNSIKYILFETNKNRKMEIGCVSSKNSPPVTVKLHINKVVSGFYGGFFRNSLTYLGAYVSSIRSIETTYSYFLLRKLIKRNSKTCLNEVPKQSDAYLPLNDRDISPRIINTDSATAFKILSEMPDIIFVNVLQFI
jgi:hypothetical protein